MLVNKNNVRILNCYHLLVAGSTGSGKSTLMNGLIYTALCSNPAPYLYLIDVKRTAFKKFRNCSPVLRYITEVSEVERVLTQILQLIDIRYKELDDDDFAENSTRPPVYIFIDEYADLLSRDKKQAKRIEQMLIRIASIGRAGNVHLIIATQTVLARIVTTEIKSNLSRCALPCTPAQSRIILDDNETGGAGLSIGECLLKDGREMLRLNIPKIPDDELRAVIDYWIK